MTIIIMTIIMIMINKTLTTVIIYTHLYVYTIYTYIYIERERCVFVLFFSGTPKRSEESQRTGPKEQGGSGRHLRTSGREYIYIYI